MPKLEINVAREDVALLVMSTWIVDEAMRGTALLVMPKWKIDVARGCSPPSHVEMGYQHGKEGRPPPCHAKMGN